jgi:hypothetical protein
VEEGRTRGRGGKVKDERGEWKVDGRRKRRVKSGK